MTDVWFAGALAALSRFIRLRRKTKYPEKERIVVNLPESVKFLIYWVIMFVWIKFVDLVFFVLFGVK